MGAGDRWISAHRAQREADEEGARQYRSLVSTIRAGEFPEPRKLRICPSKSPRIGDTWLCIGDSHAHPDYPNWRYDWLGRFICEHQPDLVWDCGDWWDMPSLSAYEKSYENLRYWRDIEAGIDAQLRVRRQIEEHTRGQANPYRPRLIRTLGNHEDRIGRTVSALSSTLQGVIGTDDLLSREFGWEEHAYLEPVVIEQIALAHYFVSGVMGRAIGGENPAAMLLKKQFHSAIQGHSHMLDYCDRTDASGRGLQAMHAGCFFDYDMAWAGREVNRMYARGLLLLHNVRAGGFDPEWWSMDRIRARYS